MFESATAWCERARLSTAPPDLPAYLVDNYWWAYLRPASITIFDHTPVVSAILWGQYGRLKRAALNELQAGQKVLQAACVYGDLSQRLSQVLGPRGRLDVIDIASIQVKNCRRKVSALPNVRVRLADAAAPGPGNYDAVVCFFLLHELPDDRKRGVVDALLNRIRPGAKVVFVDYHKPHRLHPLKAPQSVVFRYLEPFAETLWRDEIAGFATHAERFEWRKETFFGGFFQKVVATRHAAVGS